MDEGTTATTPPPSCTEAMEEHGEGATPEAATTAPGSSPAENAGGADADEEGGGDDVDVEMSSSTTEDDTDELSSSGDDAQRQSPEDRLAKAVTCKEEGNAHFKSGELDRAGRSYRRGTAALKGLNEANAGDEQVKNLLVLLQTNLSMVCLRQEKYAMSRDVATKALDVDGGNVKALYRRAAAHRKLGDVEKARDDLRAALKVDPNNREVKRELLSIRKELETSKERERQAYGAAFQKMGASSGLYDDKEELKRRREKAEREALRKRKIRWEEECARRKAKSEPEISYEDWDREETKREEEEEARRKEEEKKRREEERRRKKELEEEKRKKDPDGDGVDGDGGDGHDSSDEELLQSLKKENIRGYKKTSCGKTTSYFHRELSDQEKALIGDITPKRLGDEEGNVAGTSNDVKVVERSKSKAAESAWNQARTWEERDTTEWCTEALRTRLKEAVATAGPCIALIKKVKDVKGDASFAVASGKKKYIFDYTAQLEFEVFGGSDDGDVIGSGSLWLPDVNSTIDDGHYEVEMKWSKLLGDSYAESTSDLQSELVSSVRNSVEKFVVDFNGHYS